MFHVLTMHTTSTYDTYDKFLRYILQIFNAHTTCTYDTYEEFIHTYEAVPGRVKVEEHLLQLGGGQVNAIVA